MGLFSPCVISVERTFKCKLIEQKYVLRRVIVVWQKRNQFIR